MSNSLFRGVPKFLRASLINDWRFVKAGQPAPYRERSTLGELDDLVKEHKHLTNLDQRHLRHFYNHLGIERLRALAGANLSEFSFKKACNKDIERK